MKKSTFKKLIVAIIFVTVLIVSFVLFGQINRNNYSDKVSIIKNIIKEKYDDIIYTGDNYIYAYNKKDNYEYSVFDLNGNLLYGFTSNSKLNIKSVSNKYFITKDNKYHLYNDLYEELKSSDKIYPISDYLIYVDGNIINLDGETLFEGVLSIKKYYNNEYFLIDNTFIDKKGKVLLKGYEIVREKQKNNEIDFFIIKKDNKYYCFFPLLNKIIGDSFDKFFEYKDEVYVVSNNKLFKIVKMGLRKEIDFKITEDLDNKYNIKLTNVVSMYKVLVVKKNYIGILNTESGKFTKIVKGKSFKYEIIDNTYINIQVDNNNYIYDMNINKIIYTNKNIDDIVMFNNGYKTIKRHDMYFLYDNNDTLLLNSDKQIILLNSEIIFGKINKNIILYNKNKTYDGEFISINNKEYYKYKTSKKNIIVSKDLKDIYESDNYLEYIDETIISLKGNELIFHNLKTRENKIYNIKNYKIINDQISKKEIILSNNKNIIILNKKGEVLKKIKNRKLEDVYYNKLEKNIIIIEKSILKNKKGVYVAE